MSRASDLTFMRTFSGGDPEKIKKYVGMFIKMAAPSLSQMDESSAKSDWKSLKTTSHSLKSQMKYMGMASGAEFAQRIENICGDGAGTEEIPELLANLRTQVEQAIAELEDELSKL
ncbi:MAG: Hpt domain-containing protein [Bacteroidota bacterium]|jgi:HPt (histidine-containing phosphotransfer) domain-containing protein